MRRRLGPATVLDVRQPEIITSASAATIAAVTSLVDGIELETGVRHLSDHLWHDLREGGRPGYVGVTMTESDRLIAYAQVSSGNEQRQVEVVTSPSHERVEVTEALINTVIVAVAASGGGDTVWWIHDIENGAPAIAERAGFFPDRRLYQMRCALPLSRQSSVVTRAFVPGADDAAWLRVNNRAFDHHDEQGGWTLDMLRQRIEADWFDASGFRLYETDGKLVAFCWTKVHSDTNPPLGEIYVIAVHPDAHGSGLGSELTLAGLDWLANQGLSTGMLYVDADNFTAVAMYQRLGFTVYRTDQSFVREIAATDSPKKVNE